MATALTADPAKPRVVSALDYRGHGQSTYDRNPNNYTIQVALADLSAVLATLEITSAIFVGTSFCGVLAMMLAVLPPIAVAGVILNDIGPVTVKALAKGKRHKAAAHAANRLTRPHRHKPSGDTAICVDHG